MKVANDVGKHTGDARTVQGYCEKHVSDAARGKKVDTKKHCAYMGEQMEGATLQKKFKGGHDFCQKMLMFHSNKLEHDVLQYLPQDSMKKACTDSISEAMDQGS